MSEAEFYYREIPEGEVTPGRVRAAKVALAFCQERLNLKVEPEVRIQWIKKTTGDDYKMNGHFVRLQKNIKKLMRDRSGVEIRCHKDDVEFLGQAFTFSFKRKNLIMLRADIGIDTILKTIAHEIKHISDSEIYGAYYGLYFARESEKRAEDFASDVIFELRRMV